MRFEICLKSGMSGNNVSHSNRHTKTRFKANVHKQTLVREGKQVKVKQVKVKVRQVKALPSDGVVHRGDAGVLRLTLCPMRLPVTQLLRAPRLTQT